MTGPFASHPARYWHELDDGRIQCDLCPRFCKLHEGQRAFCFVRARQGNQIVLTTYGRSSGFCIDPVEKKALNHFLPGTPVLSFGTSGCNLGCKFCQNWDISKAQEFDVLAERARPEDIARTAERLGCPSVAYTYNDPTIFHEYAVDTAIACHERGIKSIAVTAGYVCPEPRAEFFCHMGAANIDLKGFTEDFYHKVCYAHLQPVLDTLLYVKNETKAWLEITTLLIPGLNDSEKELEHMTEWVVENLGQDVPWHFTAFHPDWRMRDIPPTPIETLSRARNIAMKNGVRYAFTGNVHDPAGQATYCHNCRALLIGREGYEITDWHLAEGKCSSCGTLCAGYSRTHPEHGARSAGRSKSITVKTGAMADHMALDVAYEVMTWLPATNADPGSALYGKVDTKRVGLAGHSSGARIALVVGEALPGLIKGVFGLDPVDLSARAPARPKLASIGIPVAFIGETTNRFSCAPGWFNYQAVYRAAGSPAVAITAINADHTMFEDPANCSRCWLCKPAGTADASRIFAYSVRYLTAFFARELLGDLSVGSAFEGAGATADVNAGLIEISSK